ncbi:NAD-binding protein [Spongisporangium articulatum]|uniref:NAD-binding protein n=1 Tax=Spongisporangium articulatum TaxID=3362603 RepID=A0ABW8ARS8_9ACTN
MPEPLKDHVIVCGLHEEGLRTIEQMHGSGVPVVVVDDHPDRRLVRIVQGWDVPWLELDARLPETLRAAGIETAVALISVDSDDLHTLETTLLARELRPDLRIVVQIRNPAVGRAVAATGAAVLDVARLSAPSLVEACVRGGAHELELAGQRFVVATVRPPRRATLRELYGDLAPVAVEPRDDGPPVLCPGRDVSVGPGDSVTVLGSPAQLRAAGVRVARFAEPEEPAVGTTGARYGGAAAAARRAESDSSSAGFGAVRQWFAQLQRSAAQALDARLRWILVGLVALIALSTTVLHLGYREPEGEGMSVLDALYFTVETIGTVGYGDFYFRDEPTWLRIYAICLMLVGAMLATVFFALITNVLVSRQIQESLGRLRVTRLSGHVVVVGLGAIGIRVVELLVRQDLKVVVVESDEGNRYLAHAKALGVPVVAGDATQPDTLAAVHLTHARAVAVVTSNDLVNIETGLAVNDVLGDRRSDVPLVLRLFDRNLARTVERSFGFDSVRSTAALAAPWFVGAALGLDVQNTFYVADTPMLVAALTVAPGSGLDGLAMRELAASTRVVALARAHGALEYPPRRDTRFAAGDVAYLVGPYDELLAVLRTDRSREASARANPRDPGRRRP